MPENYTGLGVRIMYPDNWKVEDESEHSVTIESPGGSFFTVSRFDTQNPESANVLDQAAQAMEAEYDIVEREERQTVVAGFMMNQLTQRFSFLDLIVVANFSLFTHGNSTYLLQTQGEDREMESMGAVFLAMTTSLCQSLQDDSPPTLND